MKRSRSGRLIGGLLALGLMLAGLTGVPADASHFTKLRIDIDKASVAPDGDVAGAPTDLIVNFRDLDPNVPGVGLKAGGTVRVTLPKGFKNQGTRPIAATGSSPTCAPPLVSSCSTAVLVQGWPQSPVLPFPNVTFEPDTNTVVLTAAADWEPAGVASPGPKQVHLLLLGFTNPERPGSYRIQVQINPDPNTDEVLRGSGRVAIKRRVTPSISPNSQANGAPPPPFPNTLFQSVEPGETSNVMTFYLWDRSAAPSIGVDFTPGNQRVRPIRDGKGRRIGSVKVLGPKAATDWSLESGGPSSEATAFLTGLPTGRMTATLRTDPSTSGTYRLRFKLRNGNTVEHVVVVD